MTIRVVVADDQDLVRTGLVMILGAQPDLEVVGEAADGLAALDLATRLRPDVLLVDIRMPGLDGVEVTRRLAGPDVTDPMAVVVITTCYWQHSESNRSALYAGTADLRNPQSLLQGREVRLRESGGCAERSRGTFQNRRRHSRCGTFCILRA